MARIVWTEPALQGLEAIANYVAADNPNAARKLVRKVFESTDQLKDFPESGPRPQDLKGTPYRKLSIPPLALYYRLEGERVLIVHAERSERFFRLSDLFERDQP